MNLSRYIDLEIIDEHADKDLHYGYSLDVTTLPPYELHNFLEKLVKHDPVIKELILDRMQELIDQRLPFFESKDRYERGYRPLIDQNNGEVNWVARRGAA